MMLYSVIASVMPYSVIARTFRLVTISSLCFVILSSAKDLEVYTTIHRLRGLEILHFVQNDSVNPVITHCSLLITN